MTLFYRPLGSITEDDLNALIDVQSELRTIEFKRTTPRFDLPDVRQNTESKLEFLKDISSFSNSIGGDIFYGVSADKGLVRSVPGLAITKEDADGLIGTLESVVRDLIRPRIYVESHLVELANSNLVIVMRVRRDFMLPHQILFSNELTFWGRNTVGKYKLDVDELRSLFAFSSQFREQMTEFQLARLDKIRDGNLFVPMDAGPKLVLHLIPLTAFSLGMNINPKPLMNPYDYQRDMLRPVTVYSSSSPISMNFDGGIRYEKIGAGPRVSGYVQVFRNGIIESVDDSIITLDWYNKGSKGEPYIVSDDCENACLEVLPRYLEALQTLGLTPPVVLSATLLGVRGYKIVMNKHHAVAAAGLPPVDRDDLILPETLIEDFTIDLEPLLDPLFNMVKNAGGIFD